jgi:hypothetical protein
VWAARGDTLWQGEEIDWYGGQKKTMLTFSRTALWHRPGQAPLPIRFVIVRDPEEKLRDEVFFCTDLQANPVQILQWVIMRWGVEVTFEEARAHLGMETQRQWSDKAIANEFAGSGGRRYHNFSIDVETGPRHHAQRLWAMSQARVSCRNSCTKSVR